MDKSKIPAEQRAVLGMLADDHRAVRKLFKQFNSTGNDKERQSIAAETCRQLTVHARIEEEIFYPGLQGQSDKIDAMLDEAEVEHGVAKNLVSAIESGESDMLEANYTVLTEYVGHHVEEEEGELFQAVIKAKIDLREMAAQLEQRKLALMGEVA